MFTNARRIVSAGDHPLQELADVGVGDLRRGVVGQDAERPLHARHVLRRIVDQQVDVFGEPRAAVGDDGEAADQHVAGARVVQRSADAGEVFRLRRSCVRRIVSIIAVPCSAAAVRASASPSAVRRPAVRMRDYGTAAVARRLKSASGRSDNDGVSSAYQPVPLPFERLARRRTRAKD